MKPLIVLILIAITLFPSVNALTWQETLQENWDFTDNTTLHWEGRAVEPTPGIVTPILIHGNATSTTNNDLWASGGAIDDVNSRAVGLDADFIGTTVVICFDDNTNDDWMFKKSSSSGNSWGSSSIIKADVGTLPHNDHVSCTINAHSATSYSVVYYNATIIGYSFTQTTDSGTTWSTPVTVTDYTTISCATNGRAGCKISMAAKSASEMVVMTFGTDGLGAGLHSCRTTDTGATWACQLLTATGRPDIAYVADSTYYLVTGTGTGINFYLTADGGISWEQFPAPYASADGMDQAKLVVVDEQNLGLVFIDDPAGADDEQISWTQSDDGGFTWTTPELVSECAVYGTDNSLQLASGGCEWVDAHYGQSTGKVHVLVGTTTASSPCTDCASVFYVVADFQQIGAAPIGSSATASVTNLVGFDVDPTGTRAVARTYGGDCVEIWGAKTLGNHAQCPVSNSIETNCDLGSYEDAVAAKYGGELVMFLNCDAGGDPQFLSIRDPGGNIPTSSEFTDCDPGSSAGQCPYDITIGEPGWGQFDDVGQLGQVRDFPVDYSNRDDSGVGFVARLAWAFSTQDPDPGEVGVASFVRAEPASPDVAEEAVVGYSATLAEDFCVGLDGSQYYVAAADSDENVKAWPVSFTGTLASPSIGGAVPFGVAGAAGIDCGGGQVAFVAGTTLYYATRAGTILDTYDLVDIRQRGVAISEEYTATGATCDDAVTDATCKQAILAYKDDTDVVLVFTTNLGELVLQGELTVTVDGSLKELEVDHHANGAWVAQTGRVDYYEIFNLTNAGDQVPSECIVNCEGDGFDTPGDGGLFEGSGATVGAAIGVGAFGGNLFLGAVLMGIVAYGVGIGYGNTVDANTMQPRALRVNPWAAGVGAAMGFLLAWGFGFFSTAVVFSFIVLIGMVIGIRLWVSRG